MTLERVTAGEEIKETINEYNAFHLIKSIDPEEAVTTYKYDLRLARSSTCFMKHQKRVEYLYDTLGRIQRNERILWRSAREKWGHSQEI